MSPGGGALSQHRQAQIAWKSRLTEGWGLEEADHLKKGKHYIIMLWDKLEVFNHHTLLYVKIMSTTWTRFLICGAYLGSKIAFILGLGCAAFCICIWICLVLHVPVCIQKWVWPKLKSLHFSVFLNLIWTLPPCPWKHWGEGNKMFECQPCQHGVSAVTLIDPQPQHITCQFSLINQLCTIIRQLTCLHAFSKDILNQPF